MEIQKKKKKRKRIFHPKKRKIPLPDFFEPMISNEEEGIILKKHQGRIRSFPHKIGNYPTHIYIPVPDSHLIRECVQELFEKMKKQNEEIFKENELQCFENKDYHISLSKPIVLREPQIKSFVSSLTQKVEGKNFRTISVAFGHLEWFTNDEHTRSFLTLSVSIGKSLICEMISSVDKVLKEFGLPIYYKDPKPHISIGWMLGDILPRLKVKEEDLEEDDIIGFDIKNIECKIGQWIFPFDIHNN